METSATRAERIDDLPRKADAVAALRALVGSIARQSAREVHHQTTVSDVSAPEPGCSRDD